MKESFPGILHLTNGLDKIKITHDHRQQVIEIMGNTTSKHANGLKFLYLQPLFLGPSLIGQVTGYAVHHNFLAMNIVLGGYCPIQRNLSTTLPIDHPVLKGKARSPPVEQLHVLFEEDIDVVRMDKITDALADAFFGGCTEHLLDRMVGIGYVSLPVHLHNEFIRAFNKPPKPLFIGPQGVGSPLPVNGQGNLIGYRGHYF